MLNTVKITTAPVRLADSQAMSAGRPDIHRCSLRAFIEENASETDMLLELCSKGMVVVGGGSATRFHVELAR